MPDIRIQNEGTIVLLRPVTAVGLAWLEEHVVSEPWQWIGGAIAAHPRFVQDVITGALEDGLKVAA